MPARTIRSAKAELERMAPALNPAAYRQYEREVHEAEMYANKAASGELAKRLGQIDSERLEVIREACDVRDALQELAAEAEVGRITGAEYRRRLDTLTARKRHVERRGAELTRQVEGLEELEDRPSDWLDHISSTYPNAGTTPDFSF